MELGGAGQEGLAGKPAGEEEPDPVRAQPVPHQGTAAGIASNLTHVLRMAPILTHAPAISLALAKQGGNVYSNSQAVAAIAHTRALDIAAQRHQAADDQRNDELQTLEGEGFSKPSGLLGAVDNVGNAIEGGVKKATGAIDNYAQSVGSAAKQVAVKGEEGLANQINSSPMFRPGGIAEKVNQAAAKPGASPLSVGTVASTGAITGFEEGAKQQLNPLTLMNTPTHLYRTWMDIYDKHGPAAMLEAMIPSLAGAGAGYFLAHSPKGVEEGADIGAGLTGETTAATDVPAAANAAQKSGQVAKAVVKTALKPITVPAGSAMKAAAAVSGSPTFLGANVGGLATQLQPQFKKSWEATATGMPKGETGSIGRLLTEPILAAGRAAGLPGFEKGSTTSNVLSGGIDAFSNIALLDPLGAAGRVVGQARSAEGLGGVLGHYFSGTAIKSPDDVDRILQQYHGARAFVADVPNLTSGEILSKYGNQLGGPLAEALGKASTKAEAVDVLKDSARTAELTTVSGRMPMLGTYTKIKAGLADTRIGAATGTSLPTMMDEELQSFTGRHFTMGDPAAVLPIMRLMRAMGESPLTVTETGTKLLASADPRLWQTTLANVSKVALGRQVVKAIGGGPVSDAINEAISQRAEEIFGGQGAGFFGAMGSDAAGTDKSIAQPLDGSQSRVAAIGFSQQAKGTLPTVREVQKVSQQIADVVNWSSAKGVYAKGQNLRDFLDMVVNHKFFQPLALATGGWALRVSSSEVLLNAVRLGPLNFSAAAIARSAVKHNLAIGEISTDPAVLADMDKADKIAQRAIQSSGAANSMVRGSTNLTRNVVAVVRGILAGTDEALLEGIGRQRFLDYATKAVILHDGYLAPQGISAIHNPFTAQDDQVATKQADIATWRQHFGQPRSVKNVTLSGEYSFLAPHQAGYFRSLSSHQNVIAADARFWRQQAIAYRDALDQGYTHEQAAGKAVQRGHEILSEMDPRERAYMFRDNATSPGSNLDPHTDWAVTGAETLHGAVSSQFGQFHREMLNDIADNTVPPTAKQMMEKYANKASPHYIEPMHLPRAVPGETVSRDRISPFQTMASYMHSKFFGPIVNYLSREPTWIADFANEGKALEKQVASGALTQDQADVLAQTRATYKSIRFVHNPQDRLQFEQMIHVISPFYFAKNQAMRRAGRLLASNPGAFEQYLKLNLAVQNFSYQLNQKNGQSSFVVPGSALGGKVMTGILSHFNMAPTGAIPVSLSGSADAMQTLVPWSGNGEAPAGSPSSLANTLLAPNLGPLGAIPVKAVADFTSGFASQGAKDILGPIGSNTQWWTFLVPNSGAQHIVEAALFRAGSESAGTSANTALLEMIASVADSSQSTKALTDIQQSDITGATPDPAATELNIVDQRKLIKQIINGTTVLLLGRALASYASPVSLTLQRADLKISQQAQNYITSAHGNITQGLDNFMRDHPNEVASTIFLSTSDVGSGWGQTAKDGQWMKENNYAVQTYPNAAQWLVPPADNAQTKSNPFSESTHLLQLAEGLRHVDTPEEFLTNIYVAAGNSWYYNNVRPQYEAAIKADPSNSYNIYQQYQTYIANYSKRNPSWGNYWSAETSTKTRATSLDQLTTMLADPQIPKNQQTERLGALVSGYNQYLGEKASATSSAQKTTLKLQWQQEMAATAKAWPDVAPAVTDLFSHLS